jgi:hypothetical protein
VSAKHDAQGRVQIGKNAPLRAKQRRIRATWLRLSQRKNLTLLLNEKVFRAWRGESIVNARQKMRVSRLTGACPIAFRFVCGKSSRSFPRGWPMFFVLRCLFWLGIVFAVLPWDGAGLRASLTEHATNTGKAALDEVQLFCLKDPAACANHAASLSKFLENAPATSQNTLEPADLRPLWRGHSMPDALQGAVPLPPRRPG